MLPLTKSVLITERFCIAQRVAEVDSVVDLAAALVMRPHHSCSSSIPIDRLPNLARVV
jgi:hypothetical protein